MLRNAFFMLHSAILRSRVVTRPTNDELLLEVLLFEYQMIRFIILPRNIFTNFLIFKKPPCFSRLYALKCAITHEIYRVI